MSCLQGCHVLPLWDGALQKQNEAQKLGPAPVSPSAIGHMFKLPMRHLSPKKALKIGLCRHGPSTAGSASSECFAGKTSGKLRQDWMQRYHHQGGRELVRQDEVRSGRKKEQEASLGLWNGMSHHSPTVSLCLPSAQGIVKANINGRDEHSYQ